MISVRNNATQTQSVLDRHTLRKFIPEVPELHYRLRFCYPERSFWGCHTPLFFERCSNSFTCHDKLFSTCCFSALNCHVISCYENEWNLGGIGINRQRQFSFVIVSSEAVWEIRALTASRLIFERTAVIGFGYLTSIPVYGPEPWRQRG